MKKAGILLITPILLLTLTACGDKNDQKKLKEYLKQVKDKTTVSNQDARLVSKDYQITYTRREHRNPFLSNSESDKVKKSLNGLLDQYSLDTLRLVGTLQQDKRMWALIASPNGSITKVTIGNRVSNQYAVVKKITDNAVIVITDQDGSNKEMVIGLQKDSSTP